ncbi:MAG: prepilin-type N-terminal cleavage/methylation domain-containing protein [Candidatus Sulfotelmatobacter sp.]
MTQKNKSVRKRRAERGFSLIEVMIAMVVMTIGLLAVVLSFGTSIEATEWAQEDLVARHKALDAMESIYTARNSQQLPFASINNISNGGIFESGPQPLLCAGPDGIVGTADDVACTAPDTGAACPGGVECLVLPGPDGILGTADDVTESLSNFTRTIAFTPVQQTINGVNSTNPNLIAVAVTINYTKAGRYGLSRSYTVNGLISSYH